MQKAVILFDEKTIINLPFIFSLLKRYKLLLALLPVGIFCTVFYYKTTQHPIYGLDVSFSTNLRSQAGGEQTNPMAFFYGSANTYLSRNDILAIVNSYDFLDIYARKVFAHADFERLNFNSIYVKKEKPSSELFKECSSDDCRLQFLKELLPGFYNIDTGIADFRYILKVNTLDSLTTQVLTELIIVSIIEYRTHILKKDAQGQISSFLSLMENGRKEIKEKGGQNILEQKENVESRIIEYKDLLKSNTTNLSAEKRNIDSLEIQLSQNVELLNNHYDPKERKVYDNYKNIQQRLSLISATTGGLLSKTDDQLTTEDRNILLQLQDEERTLRSEMVKLGSFRKYIIGYEGLSSGKENAYAGTEFEHKVALRRYQKLKAEGIHLQSELEKYVQEKINIDQVILKVGPELASIRQLEEKIVGLRLLLSTIVSDVSFEKYEKQPNKFSRTELVQIILFSCIYNFMIFFILNIAFFLFDDRIYSENELKSYFKEYEVIGHSPDFD